ncbi:MAG: S9 family peptidase [Pirellulaceae bacterium]|nr:S9 family peptidase [Pirellulaceae bacterium]
MRLTWLVVLLASIVATSLAAETDPLKPPAIQTEEVPVVPPEFAARLSQYQNTRAAGFAGWDPQGNGILIRTRFGNSVQMHRVYEPGGRREQITFFNEPVDGGFLPKATDGAILLSMSAGGSENDQVYLLDRAKFTTTLLTDGKSKNRLDAISPDGKRIILGSTRRNGRDTDLYLADPRVPGYGKLLMEVSGEFWSVADWSPDGKRLLLVRYVSANEAYPAILDIETGLRTDLPLPTKEKAAIGALAFAGDHWAWIATDSGDEFKRLWALDLANNQYSGPVKANWDVSGLAIDREEGNVAFTVNASGASELFYRPASSRGQFTFRELSFPRGIISSLEFSPDGKQLGFTLSRPDAPADAYSLDPGTGELTRWTYSEVGGLNPESFISAVPIEAKTFDGRMIPAWFYKPRTATTEKKAPVLIQIHGGPEGQSQPFFSGTTQFFLNELGMAVLVPNVRGSSGYGKTYLKLDNAELREDSVKDIGAMLDWIAQQPELDSSRVAVSGGSYGGFMVLASLAMFGDRIKAGIDNVGICNFTTFLKNTAAYRVDLRRVEYGDERDPKMQAVFERISPANQAEKIVSALLVAHGRNDPRVPFSEAEQIAAKVRGHGRPVWTVFADNEGHGFAKKDNADYLRAVEAYFLKRSLGIER